METDQSVYDVIVIGAGPVGQNVADRARTAGLRVAVVERELVGGECSYWACVPSKALLRPVIAVADARRIDGVREAITGSLNTAGVFGRRDRYVSNWDDSGQADAYVTRIGADLVRGHGRLDGPHRVAVTMQDGEVVRLSARHAVAICIGSGAALPDIPGIAEASPWTNRKGHRQQRGAWSAGGRRRWRRRGRDGHRVAGPWLLGHAAGPPLRAAAAHGALRR
jgi:pyruvate/2-oxoglutarate dehydrogenase complex dihydrolipoamide dehydrogenase (E3) component